MLVLSRRVGEQIVIGDNIRITVMAVQGKQVRIGVTAPPAVIVDRQEISERRMGASSPACPNWGRDSSPRRDQSLVPVN